LIGTGNGPERRASASENFEVFLDSNIDLVEYFSEQGARDHPSPVMRKSGRSSVRMAVENVAPFLGVLLKPRESSTFSSS
jgi:hypothetical protein